MRVQTEFVDLPRESGVMRVMLARPADNLPRPALFFYSDIFQLTESTQRAIVRFAGALRAGPRHPRFGSGLMGNRGVGKTAVLDAIGERVRRELGCPVLHRQVMGDMDLLADISAGLVEMRGATSPRCSPHASQRPSRP